MRMLERLSEALPSGALTALLTKKTAFSPNKPMPETRRKRNEALKNGTRELGRQHGGLRKDDCGPLSGFTVCQKPGK